MSPNYSLYSIPAYLILTMVPHLYSVYVVGSKKQRWDNANPNGRKFSESLKKGVSPATLAQFERCRAAHGNMFDNMAFVVGAVLAGSMAALDGDYMNRMLGWYLFSRVVYLVCYIRIEKAQWAGIRTAAYVIGLVLLFMVYFEAAGVIAAR